jgi:hypothetical protein
MKDRFQATLAAFEAGLEQGRLAAVSLAAPSRQVPPRWAWQLAAGLGCSRHRSGRRPGLRRVHR